MYYSQNARIKKIIISTIIAAISITGIFLIIKDRRQPLPENTFCTADARLCPDGSYVGRTGPDCEFASCPEAIAPFSSDFMNEEMEKEIVLALLSNESLSWQTTPGRRNFCIAQNLEPSTDLFPFYVWARCGEFTFLKDSLQERSGVSVPAMINYPNELSYRNPAKFTIRIPKDGEAYSQDIENIFPESLREKIYGYKNDSISKELQDKALAYFQSLQLAESDPEWQASKILTLTH